MKKLVLFVVIFSSVMLFTSFSKAGKLEEEKSKLIVENLTIGISSDNEGLRLSAAYILGQLIVDQHIDAGHASKALIPLLIMLEKEQKEEGRIVSALTLYRMENLIGIYRLRHAAKNDDSERVRKLSKNLYCDYHIKNGSGYFCEMWD